jgi:hypothetical protein
MDQVNCVVDYLCGEERMVMKVTELRDSETVDRTRQLVGRYNDFFQT